MFRSGTVAAESIANVHCQPTGHYYVILLLYIIGKNIFFSNNIIIDKQYNF